MNFLAHCVLADEAANAWQASEEQRAALLAGAIIGDFIKGAVPADWPHDLALGVRLHRKVDAISNRNASISQTCSRYPQDLRRYAPIFVDLLADHVLALDWPSYRADNMETFGYRCAEALQNWWSHMPATGAAFGEYLIEENLLAQYAQEQTIKNGLDSVIRRLQKRRAIEFDRPRVHATTLGIKPDAARDFAAYYPQMRREVVALDWLSVD